MRNSKLLLILVGLLMVGALMISLHAIKAQAAGITGTDHDLSGKGWGTDQICIFCHTPHNAKSPQLVPLWNHASTMATFTLYSSPTFNGSTTISQPTGNSKACLSCHDGTVAIDSYGGRTGTQFMSASKSAMLGTDLSNDHPISFTYDAALATADGGLNTPPITGLPLYSSKLECATCHDVHNTAGIDPFLRTGNTKSALCLKCHKK